MMATTLLSLLVLLALFIAFLFAVVVLLRGNNGAIKVLGVLLLVLPLGLILFCLPLLYVSHSRDEVAGFVIRDGVQITLNEDQHASATQQTSTWSDASDEPFEASSYPSAESASRALARNLLPIIEKNDRKPKAKVEDGKIQVVVTSLGQFPDAGVFVTEIATELDRRLPSDFDAIVSTDANVNEPTQIKVLIETADVTTGSVAWREYPGTSISEDLRATVFFDGAATDMCSVHFVDKPWVDSVDRVISESGMNLMVGRSNALASDREQALQLAKVDARHKLVAMNYSPAWTDQALQGDDIIIDQYAQRLSRPYGDVWRMAILLDLSNPKTTAVTQAVALSRQAQASSLRVLVMSILGLGLLTVGLYFLLNFLTRGFYRLRISVVVAVLALGGLTMLLIA